MIRISFMFNQNQKQPAYRLSLEKIYTKVVRAVKKPMHIFYKLKPIEKLSMYSDESQHIG